MGTPEDKGPRKSAIIPRVRPQRTSGGCCGSGGGLAVVSSDMPRIRFFMTEVVVVGGGGQGEERKEELHQRLSVGISRVALKRICPNSNRRK